jgi:phage major head subunit gpT-like protein
MMLNPEALSAMYYNFSMAFQAAFDAATPWWQQIATEVPSTTAENRYPGLASIPRMREWIGERILHNVALRSTAIVNKDWEDTIKVERNAVLDNNLGVYTPFINTLGVQARKWPDDMVVSLLQSTTATGFDGQPFFNASHPINIDNSSAGTYSNLLTGTPLTVANYRAAFVAMSSVNGEDGRSLGVRPTLLVVPPQLGPTAREIVENEEVTIGGVSTGNVMRNTTRVLEIPELSNDPTTFYLLDTSKPIKPFVVQIRQQPNFQSITDPTSENVFMRKQYVYGVDARGNAGVALPFLALKATA